MVAECTAAAALFLALVAESLHVLRSRNMAQLAFGPEARPSSWVYGVPPLRAVAFAALAWGLTVLLISTPRSYRPEGEIQPGKELHLIVVLDVSPSMRLQDSGPTKKQTRKERARDLMRSLVDRIPIEQYLISVIAVYNGAKPVVVDSRDMDVVDGIMGDLPLYQAFDAGQTRLLDGLSEAVEISRTWNPSSTTLLIFSDGDTVPPQGMPKLPVSIGDVIVVGVGDPLHGSFIDGRQSKQDVFTLRQIANRLGGVYHDGNEKHLPTALISEVLNRGKDHGREPWTRREYALLAVAMGGIVLSVLPWLLELFGTQHLPGVRTKGKKTAKDRQDFRSIRSSLVA